jgi:hypothetical protein
MAFTDEQVLGMVNEALRKVGEGQCSLMMAGEEFMRELLGVPHGGHPLPPLNLPATNTGD